MPTPMLLAAVRASQRPKQSQRAVAKAAGMGLYTYWQIENGYRAASRDERAAIAAALGVRVSHVEWPL